MPTPSTSFTALPTSTSSDEAERAARVAVLPVGSLEQHGDHLPLSTDTIVACAVAERVATTYGLRLLPPVTFSCSHEHAAWPGTVSLRASTLISLIEDIAGSLRASGMEKLVIVNGHGGNYVLSNVVQEANAALPRSMALFPGRADWNAARSAGEMKTSSSEDMHGGELETSILLLVTPAQVKDSYQTNDHAVVDRPHLLTYGMSAYTTSGIIGSPSLASAENGKLALDELAARFEEYLNVLTG